MDEVKGVLHVVETLGDIQLCLAVNEVLSLDDMPVCGYSCHIVQTFGNHFRLVVATLPASPTGYGNRYDEVYIVEEMMLTDVSCYFVIVRFFNYCLLCVEGYLPAEVDSKMRLRVIFQVVD